MYLILSSSKDTYITNKIINNRFRATDANVGQAGTIDLFKLYDENTLSGSARPVELSRALLKFDLTQLRTLKSSKIDINHSSFKCYLKLHDIYGGQTTPSNFKMIAFPLAKNFDEGSGRDIVNFADLDSTNYITASVDSSLTVVPWNLPGANASGSLGDAGIDVIVSGTLIGPNGSQTVNLSSEQTFVTGKEDLLLDVTTVVSGILSNQIADHGFCVAFSGSYEKDSKTYFVKRFASRNSTNTRIRPKLIVRFNDKTEDNHNNFIFNVSGSLFLNNFHLGHPANILSGAAATQISGDDCMHLILKSGSFSKTITASQHKIGSNYQTGIYSASFAVSQFESLLLDEIKSAHSASFTEIWSSIDETVGYYTGSLVIETNQRTAYANNSKRILVSILNQQDFYEKDDVPRIRVFAENRDREITFKKKPFEKKSEIFTKMFYRVVDADSGDVIIPFDTDTENNATALSYDSQGMYFDFYMNSLSPGKSYYFEFKIKDMGTIKVIKDNPATFLVTLGK